MIIKNECNYNSVLDFFLFYLFIFLNKIKHKDCITNFVEESWKSKVFEHWKYLYTEFNKKKLKKKEFSMNKRTTNWCC